MEPLQFFVVLLFFPTNCLDKLLDFTLKVCKIDTATAVTACHGKAFLKDKNHENNSVTWKAFSIFAAILKIQQRSIKAFCSR